MGSPLETLMAPEQPMIVDAAGRRADVMQTLMGLIPQPLRDFASGGVHGILKGQGVQMPDWLNQSAGFLQNPDLSTALGITTPLSRFIRPEMIGRPDLVRSRIGQIQRDRKASSQQAGYDVEGGDYARYRTELNDLRQHLKDIGE